MNPKILSFISIGFLLLGCYFYSLIPKYIGQSVGLLTNISSCELNLDDNHLDLKFNYFGQDYQLNVDPEIAICSSDCCESAFEQQSKIYIFFDQDPNKIDYLTDNIVPGILFICIIGTLSIFFAVGVMFKIKYILSKPRIQYLDI